MSRREEEVVFFVVAALAVDFEAGFKGFLSFDLSLEPLLTGLAATLGSLASFFTVDFFVVLLASLVAVSFLVAGFFAVEDFVALVVVAPDRDLEEALTGAFLVEVALDAFTGLFYSRDELG